jgi:predicted Zn-dependent protease
MSLSWPLAVVAALAAAFGLHELRRAFTTGRALGRFGVADRATRPAQFWVNVAVLFVLVTVPSTYIGLTALGPRRSFHPEHPVPNAGATRRSPVARPTPAGCLGPGPHVCFVAAGAAPDVEVETLASFYSTLLGSPVGVLDPIALTREADGRALVDAQRSQVGADALMRLVRATYPALWNDRDATVVILTGYDLWLETRPDWRYSFGRATLRSGGGGFAVVSTARMDPAAYGDPPDRAVLVRRLHAMVGKCLAILRYGQGTTSDPFSPVYNDVRSPADLDRMQTFAPPHLP